MKLHKRITTGCLVAASSVIPLSVAAADVTGNAPKTRTEDGASPLVGFLTLESIMLVGVVLLALVVVARNRKVR